MPTISRSNNLKPLMEVRQAGLCLAFIPYSRTGS
jgi:hypothetical protein